MKHIGFKLFLGFISMAVLTISILWIVQAGFMRDIYLKERIRSVEQAVREAAQAGQVTLADLDALAESLNASLIVLDSSGNPGFRSQGLPMMGQMLRTAQAMASAETDGTPRLVEAMSGSARYAILGKPRSIGGYLFAVFSLADLDEAALILRRQLWIVTLVLIATSIALAVFLSGQLARPVRAVTGAARALAAGSLDVQLKVRSRDEIGQLTAALNDLSVELGRTENLRRELIANVSHELRSPLTVIQGYAETVRDVTWPDESKRTAQLTIIADEATRLTRIVKDILDYSRLQSGVERLNLAEFPVCPAFDLLRTRYEIEAGRRQVTLEIKCPDLTVTFDRDRFDQVMSNLVNNAINHAAPGSVIGISAEKRGLISRITVTNQGHPIPPEDLPRIWERYYRAERAELVDQARPQGTGLGLSIVRSICERHGVAYGVGSDAAETRFWFETCLPLKGGSVICSSTISSTV